MLEELTKSLKDAPMDWIIIVVLATLVIVSILLNCRGNKAEEEEEFFGEEGLLDNRILQASISKFLDSSTVSIEYEDRRLNLSRDDLRRSDPEHHQSASIEPREAKGTKNMFKPILDKLSHLTGYLKPDAKAPNDEPEGQWEEREIDWGEEDSLDEGGRIRWKTERGNERALGLGDEKPWYERYLGNVKDWIGFGDETPEEEMKPRRRRARATKVEITG